MRPAAPSRPCRVWRASVAEREELAADVLGARAHQLSVRTARAQAADLADGERQAEVANAGAAVERPRDVDTVCRATSFRERSAQPEAGRRAPAGIDAERRIAGPDTAGVGKDRTADIEHIRERPADVEAILDSCDEP